MMIIQFLGWALIVLLILVGGVIAYGIYYAKQQIWLSPTQHTHFPEQTAEQKAYTQKIIAQMTLEEKLQQLSGETKWVFYPKFFTNLLLKKKFPHVYSGQNKRLGIPPFAFSDGPRGVVVENHNTAFPVAMARGASWDKDLEARVGDAIAKELHVIETNYFGGICINLLRHPGWGRAQETYGEDSWHIGEMALAMTKAIQAHNIMACAKHFAVNSIENARFYVDVQIDDRTLHEVYLPHFKRLVQEGEIASLMSAYNQMRGEYCGQNHELLTKILRDDWGFEGFITSDWLWGLRDTAKGINAGMDIEMPLQKYYKPAEIQKALDAGQISIEQIDAMAERVVRTKLKYGTPPNTTYAKDLSVCEAHIALAQESAEKSMVLLKNEEVLPLNPDTIKKVAVIGRLANVENTGDMGSSRVRTPFVITPYQGIQKYMQAHGGKAILDNAADLSKSKKIAEEADAVILVVGFTNEDEGEYIVKKPEEKAQAKKSRFGGGGDRVSIRLRPEDEKLIQELATSNPKLLVCYVGGSAIHLQEWKDKVPAILFSWYAGMKGGDALARVIFGEYNPSGKLPFTIPADEKDLPYFEPFAEQIEYGYYHGYALFEKENLPVSYPFGFGLSYTSFAYNNLQVKTHEVRLDTAIEFSIEVKNTGDRSGEEITQAYIGFENSAIDRPKKSLKAFCKTYLEAGETKTLKFSIPTKEIAYYEPEHKTWEIEDIEYEILVGGSSQNTALLSDGFSIKQEIIKPSR